MLQIIRDQYFTELATGRTYNDIFTLYVQKLRPHYTL